MRQHLGVDVRHDLVAVAGGATLLLVACLLERRSRMKPDIKISTLNDWTKLREEKIDVIVDPMIVRSADLWLQGKSGAGEEVWEALSQNVDSIEAFFDALLLAERIPLVDYGLTFDSNIGFEPKCLYRRVNETAGGKRLFLMNVHVMGEASKAARDVALKGLKQRPEVDAAFSDAVAREFAAFDHKWDPDLGEIGELSPNQRLLARFQYGLLLFGEFATSAGVGHLIQGQRSRMFVAGALGGRRPDYELDAELREELKKVVESEAARLGDMVSLDACPSFLPYLLSKGANTTQELLEVALEVRREFEPLRDYRKWRRRVVSDWREHGKIDRETQRQLRSAARKVLLQLGVEVPGSSFQLGLSLLCVGAQIAADRLFGWIPAVREGRGHLKVLVRTMIARDEYRKPGTDIERLWRNS